MSKFKPDQSVAAIPSSYEGGQESVNITVPSPGGAYEVQTIVPAAISGAAQGDFVIITDVDGLETAVWLDIDAAGTSPAGVLFLATDAQIEVDVLSTDTAAQAAVKINTALAALVGFTSSVSGSTVTITSTLKGNCAAPVRKNASEAGNGSFTVATTTGGSDPTIQGTYLTVNNGSTTYSLWFSSNGNGSDPAVADTTAVEVELVGNESESGVASLLASAIDGLSAVHAEADGSRVIVTGDSNINLTNAGAGDSGVTLEYLAQGNATILSPSSSVAGISTSPSSI